VDEKEAYFDVLMSRAHDLEEEGELRAEWNAGEEVEFSPEDLALSEQVLARLLADIRPGTEKIYAKAVVLEQEEGKPGLPRKMAWLVAASIVLLFGITLELMTGMGSTWVKRFLPQEHEVPGYEADAPDEREGPGSKEVRLRSSESIAIEKEPLKAPIRIDEVQSNTLPDGSLMIVNAGSEVSPVFNLGSREVTVSGEAFFNVHHNPLMPFRVRSKNIVATVLGTSFDVKTVGDEVVITVMSGQVSVGDNTHVLGVVSANHQMVVNTITLEHHQSVVKPGAEMFWEKEFLMLGDISFSEAMRRIGRRFNVRIDVINPALKDCVIHIGITPTEDMKDILEVITRTVNASIVKKGNGIKITGGSCR
jgi:hypothetical protein